MDYQRLSKEVSYALRHAPWEYELELDDEGWVANTQLLDSLRESQVWQSISEQDLYTMIQTSDKKRHEIVHGKIRALYGHSTPQKIKREPAEPPVILYHGTARRFIQAIQESGLKPRQRQYVHLSADTKTAVQVGKRRDDEPVILEIQALDAWNDGILFYHANENVWLADSVPNKYICF
jgi:putative RNA 2'-phosphotransferase